MKLMLKIPEMKINKWKIQKQKTKKKCNTEFFPKNRFKLN